MKIYLIRHGIAEERSEHQSDEIRALTDQGIAKTDKVAEKLGNLNITFDCILTSPLVRAKQTAEILYKAQLSPKITEFSPLAPDGEIEDFLGFISNSEYTNKSAIALVGHQPDLGNWAELLIWGKIQQKLTLKKAGIISIEISKSKDMLGTGELFLLTSPKWMIEL